jgi:hypothetical protein
MIEIIYKIIKENRKKKILEKINEKYIKNKQIFNL